MDRQTEESKERDFEDWEIQLRVYKAEDRRKVMEILADNGYDVGFHKKYRTKTGKTVDYIIHARDISDIVNDIKRNE